MASRFDGVPFGSLEEAMLQFEKKLREDEILMRLLAYPPQSANNPPPLDSSLPDIVDEESDEYWELVDKCIMSGVKTSDLENNAFCRIYLSEGRRRPIFGNDFIVTQEIYVEIFAHEDFEKEKRIAMIMDRVNEILVNNRTTGFGTVKFAYSNPQDSPQFFRSHYSAYIINMLARVKGSWEYRDKL